MGAIAKGYTADEIKKILIDNKISSALSTSTYILGLSKGLRLIEFIKDVEAIFITSDKKVYVTEELKDSFNLTNKEFTYEKR